MTALEKHDDELRARFPGVTAIGVGNAYEKPWPRSDGDAAYLAVIYVERESDVPNEPQTIEEIPVRFVVSGPFGVGTEKQPLDW
jgi:hypothetical protein